MRVDRQANRFIVLSDEKRIRREQAKSAGGSQSARIEAKLDYVIAMLEGMLDNNDSKG